MIPNAELSRWFGDAKAQAATMHNIEETTRRLKAVPFLERLKHDLATAANRSAEGILACAERAMRDEAGLEESIACLLRGASQDPFFRPAVRTFSSELNAGMLLFDGPDLTLSLLILPANALAAKRIGRSGRASIVFTGELSLYKFVRCGGATFSFWEAPPIGPAFTATQSGRCRWTGRRPLCDGEVLRVDGRSQSFVIDHAESDLVYLHALTHADAAPVSVEYDVDTLEFVGASSTDEVSSRTQMMLMMLRTMNRAEAVPICIEMFAHPNFYARWQAMRELLALDAEAALPHLRKMAAADPHEEVRSAAAATLHACFTYDPADAPARAMELS